MRAYGTPHALIFPIYGWSLTHIERSFFAALLKERGRGQLTGCFRPFLTCAKRRACGFSAGPSTLMRKIGFLLSFCGGVFRYRGIFLFRFNLFQKCIQPFQPAPFLRQILGQFRGKEDILHATSGTDHDILLFIPALRQRV